MYYTGFADEAANDIDGQIRATKELGWSNIEARSISGRNIHDISDAQFDEVCRKLEKAGVSINCFGSTIANWGKKITDPVDSSIEETRRAIPRMKRLGTKLVRIMSFCMMKDRSPDDQMEEERFSRLRDIVKMFSDEGLQAVHENCANYGGMGKSFSLRLVENVPGLKLVFDTGNAVMTPDYEKPIPRPQQSSWDFYNAVKDHIVYVHIKDGHFIREVPGAVFDEAECTWPGDGDADVRRIVTDLLARGYDGGFSIEPHLAIVFHKQEGQSDEETRFNSYVEYGRRFMKLVEDAKAGLAR